MFSGAGPVTLDTLSLLEDAAERDADGEEEDGGGDAGGRVVVLDAAAAVGAVVPANTTSVNLVPLTSYNVSSVCHNNKQQRNKNRNLFGHSQCLFAPNLCLIFFGPYSIQGTANKYPHLGAVFTGCRVSEWWWLECCGVLYNSAHDHQLGTSNIKFKLEELLMLAWLLGIWPRPRGYWC